MESADVETINLGKHHYSKGKKLFEIYNYYSRIASTPFNSGIAFKRDCSMPAFNVIILIEQELHAPSKRTRTIISSVTSIKLTLPLSVSR